ncbi:hypothetical protein M9458_055906, partial [Cirrhinus mrigala]
MGKNKPPLPVSELLTNQHSIPNLSFWLLETLRKLGQITSCHVHQVETDYSWALIGSVRLAFNKETAGAYLERTHRIVSNSCLQSVDLQNFTVLHLCSSHILKAVCQSFARKTNNKALKEYATYCFALLINSSSLEEATDVFFDMSILFTSADDTDTVKAAKANLDMKIMQHKPNTTVDEITPQEDDVAENG